MTFKALQPYSDGKTVRWIEEGNAATASASPKKSTSGTASDSSGDSTARGLGVAGLIVGALEMAAVFAVVRGRSAGSGAEQPQ